MESLKINQTGRLATERDIREMKMFNNPKKCISFGKIGLTKNNIGLKDPLSILLIAPAGTGKSQLMIRNLLEVTDRSFIVLDVKGEMYEKTSNYRKKIGNNVFIMNVEDPEKSSRFNFLKELPENNIKREILINLITNTIIEIKENDNNPYFANSARKILANVILCTIFII